MPALPSIPKLLMDISDTEWNSLLQFVAEPGPTGEDLQLMGLKDVWPSVITPLATPQIPSPPDSSDTDSRSPGPPGNTLVSVSTTFFCGAHHDATPADLVLLSQDSVWFYVHADKLLKSSENNFNSLLPLISQGGNNQLGAMIVVQESSEVLNVVLHTIYDISCVQYCPSFNTIAAAIASMKTYGVPLRERIAPSTPLFSVLMSHAPLVPLQVYTLAASHDLYDLAALTSSYLHSFSLASLTDEMAEEMGPVYVKRLFFLHYGRADALKRILLAPPHPHAPTQECDFTDQKKLTRAWALASAYLAWDARADLSTSTIEAAFISLESHLTCDLCRGTLRDRIKTTVVEWSDIKRTI